MSSGDVMYTAAAASISVGYMIVCLAIIVVSLVGMWKVFVKAGKPGWAAIVYYKQNRDHETYRNLLCRHSH